jgi:hypothetical protein
MSMAKDIIDDTNGILPRTPFNLDDKDRLLIRAFSSSREDRAITLWRVAFVGVHDGSVTLAYLRRNG